MPTIGDEIRRLLPMGSRPGPAKRYAECPLWPPDLFAVAASLVNLSQCFTWPQYAAGWGPGYRLNDSYVRDVVRIGKEWRDATEVPNELAALWTRLIAVEAFGIGPDKREHPWSEIAMRLLAIADEAAAGIGFGGQTAFAQFLTQQHVAYLRDHALLLPDFPYSLCMMVPVGEASVQPKSNTPQVGCTLRSLSHNLALLPRERNVVISWLMPMGSQQSAARKPFNVLLVPFPYTINGSDFAGVHKAKSLPFIV